MPIDALIVTDLAHGRLGRPAALGDRLGGVTVLGHTVRRAAAIPQVDRVALIHPPGQDPLDALEPDDVFKLNMSSVPEGVEARGSGSGTVAVRPLGVAGEIPVVAVACGEPWPGRNGSWRAASRAWAPTAWRGGLGWATVWDELLPGKPLSEAATALRTEAAVVVGGGWCCFDPDLARQQLDVHLAAPDAMRLTFSQAAVGLGPLVVGASALHDLGKTAGTIGGTLGYQPRRPTLDPISREANVAVPAEVRDCYHRLVYDTPRSRDLIQRVADWLGPRFATADAATIAAAATGAAREPGYEFARPPQQLVIELTRRRVATGPATARHHVDLPEHDLDVDAAIALITSLTGDGPSDHAITLGGLGDPLLHPRWAEVVGAAASAGIAGLCVETDLLCSEAEVDRLAGLPVDVVAVRLNADKAETYRAAMGVDDGFDRVIRNLQRLFDARRDGAEAGAAGGRYGLPWVVPKLVKMPQTLADIEGFFDRWVALAGHAVLERFDHGQGLAPDLNPLPMDPVRPLGGPAAWRPKRRLTVRADGRAVLCHRDWLGRAAIGDVTTSPLAELWRGAAASAGRSGFDRAAVCPACRDWCQTRSGADKSVVKPAA